MVAYKIRGESTREVEADSFEAAEAAIEAELEDDDFCPELGRLDECDYDIRELHRVSRAASNFGRHMFGQMMFGCSLHT